MIADKFVDLYARNSGVRDKLVAQRDIVLTYALHALLDHGVMQHLAFKGRTCLRKVPFGSPDRSSLQGAIETITARIERLVKNLQPQLLAQIRCRPRGCRRHAGRSR